MVDAFTHLKLRLEYFERHIQNSKNQEVKKEYFRTLAQVIEAENALIVTVTLKIPSPMHILKDDQRYQNNQQERCLAK
jgi:hypothetical protein